MWGVYGGGLAVQIVMWRSRDESIGISRSGSLIPSEAAVAGVAAGSIKAAEDEGFNSR